MVNERAKKNLPVFLLIAIVGGFVGYKNADTLNSLLTIFKIEITPVLLGGICFVLIMVIWLSEGFKTVNNRIGEEYGSARWAMNKELNILKNKIFNNNFLLSKNLKVSHDSQISKINNNIFVVGGSGAGKTRFFVKPNVLQMRCSYVITDPKGTICPEIGNAFKENGYNIKFFNTIDFKKSMKYNPFEYITEEKDILVLINTLIANTTAAGEKQDIWVKAEKLLYQALVGYIYEECNKEEQSFGTLMKLLNAMEVKEDDENFISPVDVLFLELEEKKPNSFALDNYRGYKQAAGKSAKSILISCQARLSAFKISAVSELMSYDELDLSSIGEKKTVLFLMTDDKDSTFDFLVGMLFTQLNVSILNCADKKHNGKLPIPVEVYADEIFNICKIPDFEKLISVMRSRRLSYSPIAQNQAQVKAAYKDNAPTIIGNCDTYVFLGSSETETCKEISARLNKETIIIRNNSESRGKNGSYSNSYQSLGRELMTPNEIATMPNDECIVFIKGYKPFKDKKYPYEKHPNYKLTGDYKKNFMFDYWKILEEPEISPVEYFKNVTKMYEVDSTILNNLQTNSKGRICHETCNS